MADVTKPNIVFVLCDNVGWGDFGVYGGGTPTPRIDRSPARASGSTITPSRPSARLHVRRS